MANRKEEFDSSRHDRENEKVNRPLLDQSDSPNGLNMHDSVKQNDNSDLNDTSVIIRDFNSPFVVVRDRLV